MSSHKFECPVCTEQCENSFPCLYCGFTICDKCINTMYYYNKFARNICPQCKTTDSYTLKNDLDNIHLYIKKIEIDKMRKQIIEREEESRRVQQSRNVGCCSIC